jgi:hypothetical protein
MCKGNFCPCCRRHLVGWILRFAESGLGPGMRAQLGLTVIINSIPIGLENLRSGVH